MHILLSLLSVSDSKLTNQNHQKYPQMTYCSFEIKTTKTSKPTANKSSQAKT